MSPEKRMRRSLFIGLILVLSAGYTLRLLWSGAFASPLPDNSTAVAADFPIDPNPLDRSNALRITSYADVLNDVTPAVVAVYPSRMVRVMQNRSRNSIEELLRRYYGLPRSSGDRGGEVEERRMPTGMGSGVIISNDGYILTNNHVIVDERGHLADHIMVSLGDGRELTAEIVGRDSRTDVAVLKVDAQDLPYLKMADSENMRVGDVVFALGNPLGVGLTVTMGIVSATGRSGLNLLGGDGYEDFIQTDASINPGNSGGALVDAEGRLVGINTAILSRTGGNIGIGFAIPINMARNILISLLETGAVRRGLLGVRISDISPDIAEAFGLPNTSGALLQQVEKGLPAHQAGLKRGDVIVGLNGHPIESSNDLRLSVSQTPPGTTVTLVVIREGKKSEFEVILTSMDDPYRASSSTLDSLLKGISVEPMSPELQSDLGLADQDIQGLVVTAIDSDSPHTSSLQVGVVILEINDVPATSLALARKALRKGVNKLWVFDHGNYGFIALRLP